ncbi:MAG TPA: GyrI-like domain-containing protein [Cytophagales bacterium]|nr:GyrI-like domain-containing protein [Cytophagales bacterium]
MDKVDLTKKYKSYFRAKAKPELVEIEEAQFLSILGKGDPSSKEFSDKIQALYSTAYAIKFVLKSKDQDFTVSKLEGLWWFDDEKYSGITISEAPVKVPRSEWEYRLLIRMPDFVTNKEVQEGIQTVLAKKQLQLANHIEFYKMREGKSVQMLHIGPFDKEPETLSQMNEFMKANNFAKNGLHHEIYLSDFNKTPAEKLKTILREPVK